MPEQQNQNLISQLMDYLVKINPPEGTYNPPSSFSGKFLYDAGFGARPSTLRELLGPILGLQKAPFEELGALQQGVGGPAELIRQGKNMAGPALKYFLEGLVGAPLSTPQPSSQPVTPTLAPTGPFPSIEDVMAQLKGERPVQIPAAPQITPTPQAAPTEQAESTQTPRVAQAPQPTRQLSNFERIIANQRQPLSPLQLQHGKAFGGLQAFKGDIPGEPFTEADKKMSPTLKMFKVDSLLRTKIKDPQALIDMRSKHADKLVAEGGNPALVGAWVTHGPRAFLEFLKATPRTAARTGSTSSTPEQITKRGQLGRAESAQNKFINELSKDIDKADDLGLTEGWWGWKKISPTKVRAKAKEFFPDPKKDDDDKNKKASAKQKIKDAIVAQKVQARR